MHDLYQLIELAKELEAEDPIDWSGLPLIRDVTNNILASSVLENMLSIESDQEQEVVMIATIIRLVVENYVLQLRQIVHK